MSVPGGFVAKCQLSDELPTCLRWHCPLLSKIIRKQPAKVDMEHIQEWAARLSPLLDKLTVRNNLLCLEEVLKELEDVTLWNKTHHENRHINNDVVLHYSIWLSLWVVNWIFFGPVLGQSVCHLRLLGTSLHCTLEGNCTVCICTMWCLLET